MNKSCGICKNSKEWVQYDVVYCKKHDTYMRRDGMCEGYETEEAYRSLVTKEESNEK